MRVGISLLDSESGGYKFTRVNILAINYILPINENDIEKGTYLVDNSGVTQISNWPIDVIELKMQEVEERMITSLLKNLALHNDSVKKKIKRPAKKRKPSQRAKK